jgi:subtilisin family serine protease
MNKNITSLFSRVLLATFCVLGKAHADVGCVPGQVVLVHKFKNAGSFKDLKDRVLAPLAELTQENNNIFVLSDESSISRAYDCSEREKICLALEREAKRKDLLREFSHLECSNDYVAALSMKPDDEQLALQADPLERIGAYEVWDERRDAKNTIVAVVDTGIEYSHEDLKENMWVNSEEIPGNRIDDDKNGFVDDVYGYDFVNKDADPIDDHGHGTHVAGIIGARGNNAYLFAGVAWETQLMAVKAFNSSGRGSLSSVLQALEYVRQAKLSGQNVRVVNASFGFVGAKYPTLDTKISELGDAGIFVVAAAGNSKQDNDINPTFPAASPGNNVLAVAAVDSQGNLASFSNFGAESVDIAAPGVSIWSLYLKDIVRMSGTSMATPFVAGSLALLIEQAPYASLVDVRSALLDGASQFDTLRGAVVGAGFLNIPAALSLLPKAPPAEDETPVTEQPIEDSPPAVVVPTPVPTIEPTPTPRTEVGKDKKKNKKKAKKTKKKKSKAKKKLVNN